MGFKLPRIGRIIFGLVQFDQQWRFRVFHFQQWPGFDQSSASDTLHKLSTPERNPIDDGFLATSLDQEPALDLELNQLVSIEDVTGRVEEAVDSQASAKQRRRDCEH